PSEYRGEFRPIPTNVSGLAISEHLPQLAKVADQFALLRSLHHDSTGHVNSTHTLLTGYPGEFLEAPPYEPKVPDAWAVATKVLGERIGGVPPYIAMPRTRYNGAAYLGSSLKPLVISADPSSPGFRTPNITIEAALRPAFSEKMG